MRDLNHDFKNLCQRNRDGSFATQHDRESILTLIANNLKRTDSGIFERPACARSMSSTWCSAGMQKGSARARSRIG